MQNVIIVHGKPSKEVYYDPTLHTSSNFAWIPWLKKQLMVRDIKADTPEMPHSYRPDYEVWRTEFERFDITSETVLVGHSMGGGFLVRWLSENPDVTVGKVVLVAPSIDPDQQSETGFCDFVIDIDMVARTAGMVLFTSDTESEKGQRSAAILGESIDGIVVKSFPNMGHFIPDDMGRTDFPELLSEIIDGCA